MPARVVIVLFPRWDDNDIHHFHGHRQNTHRQVIANTTAHHPIPRAMTGWLDDGSGGPFLPQRNVRGEEQEGFGVRETEEMGRREINMQWMSRWTRIIRVSELGEKSSQGRFGECW